jgi:superoxide reductase
MTELHQIYKCTLCGDMIEIILAGKGDLVCCGQPMLLLNENSTDAAQEKHVPVVETTESQGLPVPQKSVISVKTKTGFKVIIGSVPHPMEQAHYIQWIELIADGKSYKEFLKPGMKPEAEFCVKASKVIAREYCNLHGLWKAEK